MTHRQRRVINTIGNWCLLKKHVQQIRVSSSALCEFLNYLEAIENRHNFIYTFLLIFLMDTLEMKWCICFGWASYLKILQFFACIAWPCNSSSSQLGLSLMELGQSSASAIIYRFIAVCQKRRISFDLKYFGVLHMDLSRRKLSCEQFSSPFSLTTFTTHSSNVDWCIMMAWTLSAKILSCVTDKWKNQYFAFCSGRQWIWWFTFPISLYM